MSLSFRYLINPNYPSVSTEDPAPDFSISMKSRIRNCLKKVKQLVSTRSSFVSSLFGRGKGREFVSPAVETSESSKGQASPESVELETQRFSFDFVPAGEAEEFSSPSGCDVVGSDASDYIPASGSSSAADVDSATLSLPLASLFFFDDMNSPSDVESPRGGGMEKTVRFTVSTPKWTGESAKLGPEFPPSRKRHVVVDEQDCKVEQRVWESGARIEEETEFFRYYLNKVYKEPEAMMAAFPDGRLAEWNRILASSKKTDEMQPRRGRDCRYGGGRRTYAFCFSLHVQE
ncbi:unnamed protein product [Linum trigynum]|uniref:Uncharacterized protein n=1 Tax=Linum trigynum TaxID=586398 RepID=A0AAV2FIT8_9ROSI